MQKAVFTLTMPLQRTSPVVFASPHSGRDYSRAFRRASPLDDKALRSSEDAFVDRLFANAPRYGAPLLCATVPRAFVDLNRGADELDPALIRGIGKSMQNPRISSGLGVIPRVVAGGKAIYRGKIKRDEAEMRIREYWHPYHAQLARLLGDSHALFGQALLIDCHSMPHEAIQTLCRHANTKPEIVLGDRFGAAAGGEVVDRLESAFKAAGLIVARNKPFAGAYIAQAYGRPSRRQHVVQIEIDRALYMNETQIRPNGNFQHLKSLIDVVIADITAFGGSEISLAAE